MSVKVHLIPTLLQFPRATRKLDFSSFKAAEYQLVMMFLWPILVEVIHEEGSRRGIRRYVRLARLWRSMAFLSRVYYLPDEEFAFLDTTQLAAFAKATYELYESLFGQYNCTYNLHQVKKVIPCSLNCPLMVLLLLQLAHLNEIRRNGSFAETSAFAFEGAFARLKSCYSSSAMNVPKQTMNNYYMWLNAGKSLHHCKRRLDLRGNRTAKYRNDLVYVFRRGLYR